MPFQLKLIKNKIKCHMIGLTMTMKCEAYHGERDMIDNSERCRLESTIHIKRRVNQWIKCKKLIRWWPIQEITLIVFLCWYCHGLLCFSWQSHANHEWIFFPKTRIDANSNPPLSFWKNVRTFSVDKNIDPWLGMKELGSCTKAQGVDWICFY